MTISLVTGGSGFIGQHLVCQLAAQGHRVRNLDIEPPAKKQADAVEYIKGSVTDARVVKEAMDGVDHLYHTAAIPHLWIADNALYHETNVVGTRIVLDAAVKADVKRAVHTSSATVLIDQESNRLEQRIVDERHQTREAALFGHYARSKWRAEQLALGYADKLPVVAVLPTLPLGPGDHHLTPPSRMLLEFVNGTHPAYVDCILNIIDVRDAASGHCLAGKHGKSGQRYILNRHSLPMATFLDHVGRLTNRRMPRWKVPGNLALAVSAISDVWVNRVGGGPPLAPLAGVRMSRQPIIFDADRADSELGLPATPLDKTLKDAMACFADRACLARPRGSADLAFDNR